jgi:GntR family transcriptional regulator
MKAAPHGRAVPPRYIQVQEHIRASIRDGTWQVGEPIPPETALVERFGVARMTIRQALDGLVREGLVVRARGRGTRVARPRVERELTHMHGFSEDMRRRGMVPSSVMLARGVLPAPKEVSDRLLLNPREAVIRVERLRLADALPMALETSYFNYALCESVLQADLESGSLYEFLQDILGIELRYASQDLQAALPAKAEAALLAISRRSPVLIINQTTFVRSNHDDVPAIAGRTVYRADRYHFRLEVPR